MPDPALDTDIPLITVAIRLGVACLLGFAIGFEREVRDRPAGLRTHMLTSLAAALFAVIATEFIILYGGEDDGTQLDPIRVVEAVTAGVAFLAAGTIIQSRGNVQHMTTGATIWLAGSAGVACGAGYLVIAAMTTVLGFIIVALIGAAEARLHRAADTGHEDKGGESEPKKKKS